MNLRKLLGLCEHKWKPVNPGYVIEHSQIRVCDSRKFVTGYSEVRECANCGEVKAFRL